MGIEAECDVDRDLEECLLSAPFFRLSLPRKNDCARRHPFTSEASEHGLCAAPSEAFFVMRLFLVAASVWFLLAPSGGPVGSLAAQSGRKHAGGDDSRLGAVARLEGTSRPSIPPSSSSYRERFERDGYFVLPGLLTAAEVDAMAARVADYVREGGPLLRTKAFGARGGWYAADVGSDPRLAPVVQSVDGKRALHAALADVYGGERAYRFCGRAELNVDRGVGWHRDEPGEGAFRELNSVDPYAELPNGGGTFRVANVAVYLEDHSDDGDALRVKPGTHRGPAARAGGSGKKKKKKKKEKETETEIRAHETTLRPAKGDAVVFNVHLLHRGEDEAKSNREMNRAPKGGHRTLLSLGYGPHDVFTDDFELGVLLRNDLFNRRGLCGGEDHLNACAVRHVRRIAAHRQSHGVTLSRGTRMPALALWVGSGGSVESGGGGVSDADADDGARKVAEAAAAAVTGFELKHVAVEAEDDVACRGVGAALGALAPSLGRRRVFLTVRAPPPSDRTRGCGASLAASAAAARRALRVERIDLLLVSAPAKENATRGGAATWHATDGCEDPAACACVREQWTRARTEVREGRARAAGASGFGVACMRCAVSAAQTETVSSPPDDSALFDSPPEVNVLGGGFSVGAHVHGGGAKTARLMRAWGVVPFAEDPVPGPVSSALSRRWGKRSADRGGSVERSATAVALRWIVDQGGAVGVRMPSDAFGVSSRATASSLLLAEAAAAVQGDWSLTREQMRELGHAPFASRAAEPVKV